MPNPASVAEYGDAAARLVTLNFQATICGGNFVAIDDTTTIAGNDFLFVRMDVSHHFFCGFTNEGFGDAQFGTGKFLYRESS